MDPASEPIQEWSQPYRAPVPEALAALAAIPHRRGYIFGPEGLRPFNSFVDSKRKLDELSSVSNWVIHDLRRTAVTGMAALGVAPHVADKVLNHQAGTISGVAAVYQRYEFLAERREALLAWSQHVQVMLRKSKAIKAVAA
jgi:hypothetical protein